MLLLIIGRVGGKFMVNFKYDFTFLLKMIKFVFLPVLAVVILTAFIIMIYSKKVKEKDIKKYNYLVEFWTTLLAIMVIGALLAVTIGFSISLSRAIEMYNLVKGNEVIYYIVLAIPLVPLLFLVIYIYRIIVVLINKPKEEKKQMVLEEEIVPEPSIVENKNLDIEEVSDNSDFTKPLVFDENTVNQETIEDNADETEEEISNETLDDDKSEEIELL